MAANVIKVIEPTTSAATSAAYDATCADCITVSADKLGTGESVALYYVSGGTNVVVAELDGTQVFLTPTVPAIALEGGGSYVFQKSATAVACGVYVSAKLL